VDPRRCGRWSVLGGVAPDGSKSSGLLMAPEFRALTIGAEGLGLNEIRTKVTYRENWERHVNPRWGAAGPGHPRGPSGPGDPARCRGTPRPG